MQKCNGKFCSDYSVKDTQECISNKKRLRPTWSGACFWQSVGAGCPECGGKTVRASGCQHCLDCGASSCG
ncbi:hypothetical protein [Desulfosporosinus sp. OT]|uniref:hypothetical protein n=1 Tax=Desulfosporosinus sp. OT TaxID=913865 RepID=UPI000223A5EA|nr:hypothetical protein [Desulfosporosinus sp. OT]EGW39183.1 hypothetical protein DOT_2916 [Desulfosporosinus sp. OT]